MIYPESSLQRRMPFLLFLFTILSRLPFTARYLYHLDSGHFALSLDNYDLTLHQPHPPGYFLFVMSGRAVNLLVHDPNWAFIIPAILFSAFTVVVIHRLASEMFDENVAILAALLAATSPNLWFHGEVALSYGADAFFSAATGLLCWRALRGKRISTPASAAVLALAGGFRQNAPVFLFPLWLHSVRKAPFRSIVASLALFCAVTLAWVLPMIHLTGGIESYLSAFRELWIFNTGHNSVFEKGVGHLVINLLYLNAFSLYSLGAALPFLPVALYALIRSGRLSLLRDERTGFLAFWILPSLLFYLLIFLSGNPGYFLILLPPFAILASVSVCYLVDRLGKKAGLLLSIALVCVNSLLFLYGNLPVSRSDIREHDAGVQALVGYLSGQDYRTTALFIKPDSFYSFRHLMVYLPRFTVYQVDVRIAPDGERRKQFWGREGTTRLTASLTPPKGIRYFAAVVGENARIPQRVPGQCPIVRIAPKLAVVTGPIERVCELYPELEPQWNPGNRVVHSSER